MGRVCSVKASSPLSAVLPALSSLEEELDELEGLEEELEDPEEPLGLFPHPASIARARRPQHNCKNRFFMIVFHPFKIFGLLWVECDLVLE